MIARKLNKKGLRVFELFIEDLRQGLKPNTPTYLLDNTDSSEAIPLEITLNSNEFTTRYELGEHLVSAIDGQDMQPVMGDTGFWSWLALYWFDQLCPLKADGSRKPSMAYNYVLSNNYNHRPRHAIYTTWQLVGRYGGHSRFLLCKELPVRGELIEQMMARQYLLSCEGVMEAAASLYWDGEIGSYKKGSAARKSAGCVARFVGWLQQLELTYDLFSLKHDDIMELMPVEFDRFKFPGGNKT